MKGWSEGFSAGSDIRKGWFSNTSFTTGLKTLPTFRPDTLVFFKAKNEGLLLSRRPWLSLVVTFQCKVMWSGCSKGLLGIWAMCEITDLRTNNKTATLCEIVQVAWGGRTPGTLSVLCTTSPRFVKQHCVTTDSWKAVHKCLLWDIFVRQRPHLMIYLWCHPFLCSLRVLVSNGSDH